MAVLLTVLGVAAVAGPAAASDTDPAPLPPDTGIDVSILPSTVGASTATTVTLLRDGVPVGPDECVSSELAPDPDGPGAVRQLECAGLVDGMYALQFADIEEGNVVATSCTDIVAARTASDAIQIGNGYTEWSCQSIVGPPAIFIADPTADSLGMEIRDSSDAVVSDTCDLETSVDSTLRSCQPLPFGVYTTASTAVPLPETDADVVCQPFDSGETVGVNDNISSRGTVAVTAQHPIWLCYAGTFRPLLSFSVAWTPDGETPPPADWLDALTFRLVDTTDPTVAVDCTVGEVLEGAQGASFLEGTCPDVPDGMYALEATGVPTDFFVADDCVAVTIDEFNGGSFCTITVSNQALVIDPPIVDDPPATDDPARPVDPVLDGPELPVTGSADALWLWIGTVLIAVGAVLVGGGRRRHRWS